LSDFGPIPCAGPGPESSPKEFDGGKIRVLFWHLSEMTYYDEASERNPQTEVKATIILYDKSNPRPVIRRIISRPGQKPTIEYESSPKSKD
jgi:hypothetical protein